MAWPCDGKTAITPAFAQSDAALYPNSRTWAAEEGIYLVGTMNNTDNPYFVPKPGMGGLITPSSAASLVAGTGWLGYFPSVVASTNTYDPMSSCTTTLPFDVSGAIFAGLANQSAMQVTVRYYIERNPTIADPNLLVLARTPCPYDPVALEIYTRCMSELQVGVPVKMNPLGEWFTEVLEGIGEWAPKIGKAIGNIIPGGAIIGNALGGGAKLVKGFIPQKKKGGGNSSAGKSKRKPRGPPPAYAKEDPFPRGRGGAKKKKRKRKRGNSAPPYHG